MRPPRGRHASRKAGRIEPWLEKHPAGQGSQAWVREADCRRADRRQPRYNSKVPTISLDWVQIPLREPFRISNGSVDVKDAILVSYERDGVTGKRPTMGSVPRSLLRRSNRSAIGRFKTSCPSSTRRMAWSIRSADSRLLI